VGIKNVNPPSVWWEICGARAEEFEEERIPFSTFAAKEETPSLIASVDRILSTGLQ
jgi:hypothetical protein